MNKQTTTRRNERKIVVGGVSEKKTKGRVKCVIWMTEGKRLFARFRTQHTIFNSNESTRVVFPLHN